MASLQVAPHSNKSITSNKRPSSTSISGVNPPKEEQLHQQKSEAPADELENLPDCARWYHHRRPSTLFPGLLTFTITVAMVSNFYCLIPSGPDYVARLDSPRSFSGILIAIPTVVGVVCSFLWDAFIRYTQSYRLAYISISVVTLLANLVYALAATTGEAWVLVLSRILLGVGIVRSITVSWMAAAYGRQGISRVSHTISSGQALGVALGSAIATLLALIASSGEHHPDGSFIAGHLYFDQDTLPGWFFAAVGLFHAIMSAFFMTEPEKKPAPCDAFMELIAGPPPSSKARATRTSDGEALSVSGGDNKTNGKMEDESDLHNTTPMSDKSKIPSSDPLMNINHVHEKCVCSVIHQEAASEASNNATNRNDDAQEEMKEDQLEKAPVLAASPRLGPVLTTILVLLVNRMSMSGFEASAPLVARQSFGWEVVDISILLAACAFAVIPMYWILVTRRSSSASSTQSPDTKSGALLSFLPERAILALFLALEVIGCAILLQYEPGSFINPYQYCIGSLVHFLAVTGVYGTNQSLCIKLLQEEKNNPRLHQMAKQKRARKNKNSTLSSSNSGSTSNYKSPSLCDSAHWVLGRTDTGIILMATVSMGRTIGAVYGTRFDFSYLQETIVMGGILAGNVIALLLVLHNYKRLDLDDRKQD